MGVNIVDETTENKLNINIADMNFTIFDAFNSIAVGSNTIILCFWVHSKYEFTGSTDKSSSIVKNSSISVTLYYLLLVVVGWFRYLDNDPKNMPRFILYGDRFLVELNPTLFNLNIIYKFVNSIGFLLMVNFYFMVIKQVILRKHFALIFRGFR